MKSNKLSPSKFAAFTQNSQPASASLLQQNVKPLPSRSGKSESLPPNNSIAKVTELLQPNHMVSNNGNPNQSRGSVQRLITGHENHSTNINNAITSNWDSKPKPTSVPSPTVKSVSSAWLKNVQVPEAKVQNPKIAKILPEVTNSRNGTTNSRNQDHMAMFALDLQNTLFKNWDLPSSPLQPTINNPLTPQENTPSNYRHQSKTPVPGNCLKCMDFSVVDAHAAKFPRQSVTSLPKLAIDLTSPLSTKTEKARAIFVWLHHNIAYNAAAFFSGNIRSTTPSETVRTGLAVCQGYAELFADLGKYSGLEVMVVSGHGKGYSYIPGVPPRDKSNHAWNAVRLDRGEWHLLDACWGAGHLGSTNSYVKDFNEIYFTSSPEIFRLSHFPTNPSHQMCQREMSWSEYIQTKEGPIVYSNFKDYGFCKMSILPNMRFLRPQQGVPIKFVIKAKCEHSRIRPEDQYVLLLSVDGTKTPFQVDPQGTTWTCESQLIRQGSDVSVYSLQQFADRSAKGVTVEEYLKPSRFGSSFIGLCKWDA